MASTACDAMNMTLLFSSPHCDFRGWTVGQGNQLNENLSHSSTQLRFSPQWLPPVFSRENLCTTNFSQFRTEFHNSERFTSSEKGEVFDIKEKSVQDELPFKCLLFAAQSLGAWSTERQQRTDTRQLTKRCYNWKSSAQGNLHACS